MSGSAQVQMIEVEDLVRDFIASPSSFAAATPARSWGFAGRPVIAACLAVLIFAPGCAAAAVFLMRADGTVPPVVTPDSNPPFVTKSDRLPIAQWSVDAVANLGAADDARMATASANADPGFMSASLIRGSLEDGTLTTFDEPALTPEPVAAPAKPQPKRIARRIRPARLVAEVVPPPPPEPSFFEKLFGPRTN